MDMNKKVRLVLFDGLDQAPEGIDEHENYWALIGVDGVIVTMREPAEIKIIEGGPRVLVRFDKPPSYFGLECHNSEPDALWIRVSDLEFLA